MRAFSVGVVGLLAVVVLGGCGGDDAQALISGTMTGVYKGSRSRR